MSLYDILVPVVMTAMALIYLKFLSQNPAKELRVFLIAAGLLIIVGLIK